MRSTSSRIVALGLLVSLLFITLTQTACPGNGGAQSPPTKQEFVAYAREGVTAMREDVLPILRANNIKTEKWEKGIGVGDKLVIAFENNQNGDALLLTADLLNAFDDSVLDFELIKDGKVKTAVLVGCAIARIALRRLASLVQNTVTAIEAPGIILPGVTSFQNSGAQTKAEEAKATIKAFAKKKQFRCKNAATGKFAPMAYCKANPETSYVVTFYKK